MRRDGPKKGAVAKRWALLVPSILLAAGIIASTAAARMTSESGWLVMAGPLVMALAVLAAGRMGHHASEEGTGRLIVPAILGIVILLAGVIVAWRDPGRVAALMPLLGICASTPEMLALANRSNGRCGHIVRTD